MDTIYVIGFIVLIMLMILFFINDAIEEHKYEEEIREELDAMNEEGIKYDLYYTADGDVEILVKGSN